jgi:DNA polymerase III delta subunit
MAVPHPERELERLQKTLQQPLPAVLVVSGVSGWFRQQAMDLLLAAVPAVAELRTIDGAALDLRGAGPEEGAPDEEAGGDEAAPGPCPELLDLGGAGLFAKQNFLCVRRGDRWLRWHGPALAAFVPRIGKGCGLLLEVQKLDRRTKLSRLLEEQGELFEFRELYESPFGRNAPLEGEAVRWIVDRARAMGLQLAPAAALQVMTEVGKGPGELVAELMRLSAAVPPAGRKRVLQPQDLQGLLNVRYESTPFELAEAILARDRRRALRSLRAMFERGVRQRDGGAMDQGGVFPFATSWLYGSLANALEGRILRELGVPDAELCARAGVRTFQERFLATVAKNDQRELRRGILLLLECQRALRLTGEEPQALLERFVDAWFRGQSSLLPGMAAW